MFICLDDQSVYLKKSHRLKRGAPIFKGTSTIKTFSDITSQEYKYPGEKKNCVLGERPG